MNFFVSTIPVFLLLIALIYLDSFKLVTKTDVVLCILYGIAAGFVCYYLNIYLLISYFSSFYEYAKTVAPIIEELIKAILIIIFIKRNKIGFMIDGAILGFAVGAGFALIENIFYINSMNETSIIVWLVRGIGTSVMHGGSTAIFGIICMYFNNKTDKFDFKGIIIGLIFSIAIHWTFNQFWLYPILFAVIIFVFIPFFIIVIFNLNERSLRKWLEVEFSTEISLLQSLRKGEFSKTKSGRYFNMIKGKFSKEIVVDMICFIQLYLELSIKTKSILLLKEAGLPFEPDPEIKSKLKELASLQKNIGKTGYLAIAPILRIKKRDMWKINFLEQDQ